MNHLPEILLSNLFLLFIWGFFELFLRNTKSFQANRFFLLTGSLLGVLLPWLPWQIRIPVHTAVIPGFAAPRLEEILPGSPLSAIQPPSMPNGPSVNWVAVIYFSVVAILALTFLAQTIRMYLWTRRRPVTYWDRYRVVELDKQWPAFSFFGTIYYPEPFEPDKRETMTILEHERVHARELHSVDNLLLLVLRILFFYNPAVHLLAGRLRLTHEYLADAATAGADKAEYSQTLIRHQFLVPRLLLMHSFNNQSFLKRRLNMLMKSNTRSRAAWIYLLAAPLAAGMILLSGWSASAQDPQDAKKKVKTYDEAPVFKSGSFENFGMWVLDQIKGILPVSEKSFTGKVVVSYVVTKQGNVENVMLIQGLDPTIDAAVLKAVSASPVWQPGKFKGKPTDVTLSIPLEIFWRGKPGSAEDVALQSAKSKQQDNNVKQGVSDLPAAKAPENQERKVFLIVEDMPAFQGGTIENFRKWLQSSVNYPDAAREKKITGTVYVSFIVDTTGRVVDPHILRSIDPILDAEVLRVLCSAPLWEPGRQRGSLVNVSFSIPVSFEPPGTEAENNAITREVLGKPVREGDTRRIEVNEEDDDTRVFLKVDEMPEFEGGDIDKFRSWVQAAVKYPKIAMKNKIKGTVYVQFVVGKTGEVKNITILRPLDPSLDDAVIEAIKTSPAWTPGRQDGLAVNVSFVIPVIFILN